MSSSGMPRTLVVQVSPALTGIASIGVPVETASPARRRRLCESLSRSSTRWRNARSGLSSTKAPDTEPLQAARALAAEFATGAATRRLDRRLCWDEIEHFTQTGRQPPRHGTL
jgi:hypothetical protein